MNQTANIVKRQQPVKMRIGVFFDGTGKNANNLLAANEQDEHLFTNIYRLYKCYGSNENLSLSVYIEGTGTKDGERVCSFADASGMDIPFFTSGYGVFAKYKKSVEKIVREIEECLPQAQSEEFPLLLTFDVFGFSRGAAIARHLVNMLNSLDFSVIDSLTEVIRHKNYAFSQKPEINFLGLFDTVTSVWRLDSIWDDPHDSGDSNGLRVNLKEGAAKTVFQITAMHECRYNYPLNSVASKFYELEMAGGHGDIGGSPANEVSEEKEITKVHYNSIINNPEKEVSDEIKRIRQSNKWNVLLDETRVEGNYLYSQGISRRKVSGDLQYVAYMVMLKVAIEKGCPFSEEATDYEKKIPDALRKYYKNALLVKDAIFQGKQGKIEQKIIDEITSRYVHISATWKNILWPFRNSADGVGPIDKTEDDDGQRALLDNYQPNRPDDNWSRKIFHT